MSRMCEICGKTKQMGNNRKLLRGHYNITSRRTFKPNLQTTLHEGKRILACVNCLRTKAKRSAEQALG